MVYALSEMKGMSITMKNERDLLNNKFYSTILYIFNFFITNLWFLLLISPVIFYLIYAENTTKPVVLILSIIIGPSITTLFSIMGKLLREGEINPTRDFFHYYKLNLPQGLLVGMVLNILISIIYFDIIYFSSNGQKGLVYIMFALLLFVILLGFYAYPIMSRYNVKILFLFKLSIELLIKKIHISLTCLAVTIICLWLVRVTRISLIGLLFGASVICYLIVKIQRNTIDKLEDTIKEKYKNS